MRVPRWTFPTILAGSQSKVGPGGVHSHPETDSVGLVVGEKHDNMIFRGKVGSRSSSLKTHEEIDMF